MSIRSAPDEHPMVTGENPAEMQVGEKRK